jgi:hypothetical protein
MRRALAIGSQTGGLAGADNDARDMAAWLAQCGFAVDCRVGRDATRGGILEGIRALIAEVRPDDAIVVYYSGHGGLLEIADVRPWRVGYLVPTDYELGGTFSGITELEWSSLIAGLTACTRNVAIIHDCCHAARVVRGAQLRRARPRALAAVRMEIGDLLQIVRASGGASLHAVGNPDAVRFAAAGAQGLAWEQENAGGYSRGVFTSNLLAVVAELGEREISWAELARRVRERVLQATGRQRPEMEGPSIRRMFGVSPSGDPWRTSVRQEGRRFVLAAGRVHGVERGDVFRSVLPERKSVVVIQAGLFESAVRVEPAAGGRRAFEVVAASRRTRLPMAIQVDETPLRSMVATAIDSAPRLSVADEARAVARVQFDGRQLWLSDENGAMCGPFEPDAEGAAQVTLHLSQLASAHTLRLIAELLDDPGNLAMRVQRITPVSSLLADGAEIGVGDRICVHVANRGARTIWLHLFAVGPGSAAAAIGPVSSGAPIEPGETEVLGAMPGFGLVGFELPWPPVVPRDRSRSIELIAIATTVPADLTGVAAADVTEPGWPNPSSAATSAAEASRDVGTRQSADHASAARLRLIVRP